jgi:chromosome segregation ATPase
LPVSPPHLEPGESLSPPPILRRLSTLTENQPAPSADDPEQLALSFVERNQKEAEDHLRALTAEAQQLRARLAKLESGIKKWQDLVSALKSSQGQSVTSTANAPGAEDAGDLEPIKPIQAGGARADKHVKWATATSAAAGASASAQPAQNVDPPQQLPAAQPLPVVVPGSVPK